MTEAQVNPSQPQGVHGVLATSVNASITAARNGRNMALWIDDKSRKICVLGE
jgi:hypothetical protein